LSGGGALGTRPRRSSLIAIALVVAVLAFLVSREGSLRPPEMGATGAPDPDPPAASGMVSPTKGYLAPDFAASDLEGRRVRLSNLRGKAVFINFWATWCAPCKKEMPAIGRLALRLPPDAAILTVAGDSGEQEVRRFVRALRMQVPVILDADGAISNKFRIAGIPTTLVLDPRGVVVKRVLGPRAWDDPQFVTWLDRLGGSGRASSSSDSTEKLGKRPVR
jgi:cytochrome c biogenesis protein CcmG/thiol:disulfide interchange protein DsbE